MLYFRFKAFGSQYVNNTQVATLVLLLEIPSVAGAWKKENALLKQIAKVDFF